MAQRGRAIAAVTAAAFIALVAGGCSLLLGGGFSPFDPEVMMSSSPLAEYAEGSATIEIADGETITLDQVGAGSRIDSLFGSEVQWSNGDGWSLRVSGAGADYGPGTLESTAYLTIDRISGSQHWSTFDPGRCIVDVEVADASGFSGTATCRGLTWFDAMMGPLAPVEPSEVDEPEFDAEITFEATP